MFGLSLAHMILLGALALIVIGPKQLPEVARTIGRFLNEIKRVTSDVTKTLTDARDSTDYELRHHSAPYSGKENEVQPSAETPAAPIPATEEKPKHE